MVVVSRGRPAALARCLLGVSQLAYPRFEVVVAADAAGLAATAPWGGRVRRVPFGEANVSAARNAAVAQAAGEALAFLDDDAVPEPLWLAHLLAPFADARVAAVGGQVRGPDGIRPQGPALEIARDAAETPLGGEGPRPGLTLKTEGTSMAVRAGVLRAMGGFDGGFRFWLDEADLDWRLMEAGHALALAPLAEVHHGALPSERRRADRVARTLREVGASLAVWGRRRGVDMGARLGAERAARRRTLLGHMVAGRVEPRDVGHLLATLDAGFAEGLARDLPALAPLPPPAAPFLAFAADPPRGGHRLIATTPRGEAAALARARAVAAAGEAATVLVLSRGARRHRAAFEAGAWVQRGGLWGPSAPGDPRVRRWTPEARAAREGARLAPARGAPS